MNPNPFRLGETSARRERPVLFGPDAQMQLRPWITAHPVGLFLAIGLGLILVTAFRAMLLFLIPAAVVGAVIGLILYLKHR